MNDLISRDAAVKALMEQADMTKDAKSDVRVSAFFESAACTIQQMPAVDAEPVRYGTWELVPVGANGHITAYHGCSVCGCVFKSPSHYCPNCGAKMDGDEK